MDRERETNENLAAVETAAKEFVNLLQMLRDDEITLDDFNFKMRYELRELDRIVTELEGEEFQQLDDFVQNVLTPR